MHRCKNVKSSRWSLRGDSCEAGVAGSYKMGEIFFSLIFTKWVRTLFLLFFFTIFFSFLYKMVKILFLFLYKMSENSVNSFLFFVQNECELFSFFYKMGENSFLAYKMGENSSFSLFTKWARTTFFLFYEMGKNSWK